MQAEHFPQPGQLVGGKYRTIRELGRGAMGAVFEAEHVGTGKHVAVKWLHPHVMESRSAVERLVREAQASARVRHSNVVDVYDVERDGDTMFLVMEYLEGEPLSALLERGGAPFYQVLGLIVQAMRGVAEAHRQGIVHRDIKPDNIFLAYQADLAEPVAKVLDFGISKLDVAPGGLSLTQTGSALGTPLYMSYEQLSGSRDVDARTDIYAFGVILYETLTGALPYSADNFAELAAKVITTEPPTPRELRPDIPEQLELIVLWAMRKRREERPPTLAALVEALAPFTEPPQGRVSFAMRQTASTPPVAATPSYPAPPRSGETQLPISGSHRPPSGSQLLPGSGSHRPPSGSQRLPASGSHRPPSGAHRLPSSGENPSLRLDPSYQDWGPALDRSQRTRREMEDRVTALIAGTMHEYPARKPATRRGMWMALGALTTLAAGGGIASFLLREPAAPTAARPAPVVAAPAAEEPAANEATPAQKLEEAAPAAAVEPAKPAEEPAPELPPAAPTQVEPVQMKLPDNPPAREAAVPAPSAPPTKQHAGRQPARTQPASRSGAAGSAWAPSGEPPVYVQPAPAPEPAAPEPAVEPAPKPPTIEVPGTAPNPFADGDESPKNDESTKYRAGKPSEEEF